MIIDPKSTPVSDFHKLFLGAVSPRPVAFVSSINQNGKVNLSPFSFFNCFSINPPVLVFSPSRRVRDNTTKHTLENVLEVPEVVINMVNFELVQQASLASTEFAREENEFIKAGLTPVASERVGPPRVKESPVSFECKVNEVISLGKEGGAGNLVICEVLLAHLREDLMDENGRIDPHKIDLVARMGENYYCRASGSAVFEVEKPLQKRGMGVDQIPEAIRLSKVLSGNNLGQLGNVEQIPGQADIEAIRQKPEVAALLNRSLTPKEYTYQMHLLAKKWLEQGKVTDAWRLLLLK